MTPHDAIRLFTKTLENLEKWMDKAGEHAKARSFEVDVLAQARLAPNQFAFVQRCSRLRPGQYAPPTSAARRRSRSHPDTEKTFAELRADSQMCTGFLSTVGKKDFVALRSGRSRAVLGAAATDTTISWSWPFRTFFHVAMADAILRHNGVELGKMDYIGGLPTREG